MKKKILSIFLAFCLIFSLLPMGASADEAHSGTCGENLTWVLKDGTLTISGTGKMYDYDFDAFHGRSQPWGMYIYQIKSVVIEDGVTSIGDNAFKDCSNLTKVTVPSSVTSVGSSAFYDCTALTEISIANGVKSIGGYAFKGCKKLVSITLPDSVTELGSNAFRYCTKLKTAVLSKGMTQIEERTFVYCEALERVTIPKGVTKIIDNAFDYCKKIADIAYGGTKEAWEATGYEVPRNQTVKMHYNCDSFEGHYVPINVVKPTCKSSGRIEYLCPCGYEYTEYIPGGHDYTVVKTVASTCSEHGYDLLKCKVCGYEKKDYKDDELKAHTYVDKPVEPTCLTGGYTEHKCSVCGSSYRDSLVQPLGHNFKNGKCTRCGAVDASFRPDAPQLKITTASGHPKIYWDAVDGAAKYWVYRSKDGVNFKYYDSTTKTSYTNKSTDIGTTYYYKVKAVAVLNGKNVTSDYSVVKSIRCRPAAVNLSIYRVNGKPKLSWKAVSGATKYWIYRSTDGVNFKYFDSTTKTSYTNSGAASGTKYYYRVKAVAVVNGKNVASAYSNSKNLMTTLAAPFVSITTANGKPRITWKAVTGADKYYIYRSTDGKTFSYWDATANLSYTNLSAKKNTKYYYKVKAVCASNSYANSAQSAAVSITATK